MPFGTGNTINSYNGVTINSILLTLCQMANYIDSVVEKAVHFGEMLRRQRITMHLTLQELAAKAKVSPSHLGRIEKGTRFPSAHVLKRIAKPLGYQENQLFAMAGYLTYDVDDIIGKDNKPTGQVDPYVAQILGQESVDTQWGVIGILSIMKSIARANSK